MIVALLWALATIDAAFRGYRAASGRSAIIHKETYYLKAMLRGVLTGQAVVLISSLFAGVELLLAGDPQTLWMDMLSAGRRMITVYVPYAALIMLSFALRLIPSIDVRSILSVLVFGPFTFIRPAVVTAGITWAIIAVPRTEVIVLGLLVLVLMLSLEHVLARVGAKAGSPSTIETRSRP